MEQEDPDTIEEDAFLEQEMLEKDLPCVQCGYNLRGLKPAEACPECGTGIRRTIAYALQEVLCPVCMRPNHATQQRCMHCGAPISGAAQNAAYWESTPLGAPRVREGHTAKGKAPPAGATILAWLAGLPLGLGLFWSGVGWLLEDGLVKESLVRMVAAGVIFLVIGLLTWSYRKVYAAWAEANRRPEEDEEDDGEAA